MLGGLGFGPGSCSPSPSPVPVWFGQVLANKLQTAERSSAARPWPSADAAGTPSASRECLGQDVTHTTHQGTLTGTHPPLGLTNTIDWNTPITHAMASSTGACKSIPQQITRQRIAPASGRHVSMHTRRQLRNATDMLRSCLDAAPHDDWMIVPGVLQLDDGASASAMALHMQTSNQPSLQLHVTGCTQQRQPTSQASIHPSLHPSLHHRRTSLVRSHHNSCTATMSMEAATAFW